MSRKVLSPRESWPLFTLVAAVLICTPPAALAQETELKAPEPGVPEIFTIMGEYVRIAYNDEGYVSLGFRAASQSVGEEWMLLEFGTTLRHRVPPYRLKRDHISIDTPDGTNIVLANQKEFNDADVRALVNRAKVVRDSINYFPRTAGRACVLKFFSDPGTATLAYDDREVNWQSACLGRLYFKVPGGIKHGQHFLNVQFDKSLVRVPFRILTKEEEKTFSKTWQDVKKEHEKRFK